MSTEDQDQRSEAPTPFRLQKALEEGQIGVSGDLISGLVLLVGVLYFAFFGTQLIASLKDVLRWRFADIARLADHPERLPELAMQTMLTLTGVVLGLLVPLFFISLLSGGLQTQFNLTFKPLEAKWSRLDPIAGTRRLFSLRAVMRGIFLILKSAVVALVTYWLIRQRMIDISLTGWGTLDDALTVALSLILAISVTIAALLVLIGVADLGFQKWKNLQELRMTPDEIRKENRELAGDPLLKARLRRMQAELLHKSLRKEVPKATVVITNPTHFAVALRYERGKSPAPIVVAKGADLLAKRIIEIAKEHDVAVVERKPVARYLYFKVPVGKAIPVEMYQAVAEVLNFINRLRRRAS